MNEDLQDLLVKTSRTFAASIPLLEGPLCQQVTLGYLLLRIADTLEDAAVWTRTRRIEALERFARLLEPASRPDVEAAATDWLSEKPTEHAGYLELLESTPVVFDAYLALDEAPRIQVERYVRRTTLGMSTIVASADEEGTLELEDLGALRDYCYVVAGIVGEMLTELFLLDNRNLQPFAEPLRRRSAAFGEALQLVNILKDSGDDADEGRTFLPSAVDRSEVFALARADLHEASQYVNLLQRGGASRGTVAFTALPARLAWATLARVESQGAGAKLTRAEVGQIMVELQQDLETGAAAAPVH